MRNKKSASLQDADIRDHYTESMRLLSDVQRWTDYGKDDLPNAILGHILEVNTSCFYCCLFSFRTLIV